jgi:hypothetical protein
MDRIGMVMTREETMHRMMAIALALSLPSSLWAAPPAVSSIVPRGAERGKTTTVTVTGTNLTARTQLALPFTATQKRLADAKPNPAEARFELSVPASVPLGIYPFRVLTEEGVSALSFFGVDAFPSVQEVEGKDSFDNAQRVPFPVIITGQCPGGDVDFYRFTVKKGQRVVIETEAARLGSSVLPQIRVTDSRTRLVVADDSQKLRGDCRVWFTAPEDGDYVVEFSDSRYRGGAPPHYRLKIADYDFADEIFPLGGRRGEKVDFTLFGGNLAKNLHFSRVLGPSKEDWLHPALRLLDLQDVLKPGMLPPEVAVGTFPEQLGGKNGKGRLLTPPVTINGRLAERGEIHRYSFPVKAGQRLRLRVEAESLGSYLDGVLRVTDQTGKQLMRVDDVDQPPLAPGQAPVKTADPVADVTVPAGVTELTAELRDGVGRGGVNFGYRLTIEPARDDFTLVHTISEINVPAGGTALLPITVRRHGYGGPIQLNVSGLPVGWSWQGGYVPSGANSGLLTVTAAAGAVPAHAASLTVTGCGRGETKALTHIPAEQHIVLSRDGNVAASTLRLTQLPAALTGKAPFHVRGPAAVEIVQGYAADVPVMVNRDVKPATAIEVSGILAPPGVPPPPGLTAKPAAAGPTAATATFTVSAATTFPEGRAGDLVVQGKAKISNKDEVMVGPAVSVTVVRPFVVALLSQTVSIKPGQTAQVKGRLQRQPVFREAVQVTLDGLPAGLTLATAIKSVAAGQNDFLLDLRADAKAPPANAKLTLSCSATIKGIPYKHPAVLFTVQVQK